MGGRGELTSFASVVVALAALTWTKHVLNTHQVLCSSLDLSGCICIMSK
jgi:hypothetical protein